MRCDSQESAKSRAFRSPSGSLMELSGEGPSTVGFGNPRDSSGNGFQARISRPFHGLLKIARSFSISIRVPPASKDPMDVEQENQEMEEGLKGSPQKGAVHVNPIGENWEVESDAGTLGQAETKEEAVELAKTLAKETGAPKVTVHESDGSIAQEMPTK